MSSLTPAVLGVILLAGFAVFYALNIFAKVTAVIGLVGVVLLGGTGWVGRALTAVTAWAVHLTDSATVNFLGVTFTGLLTLVLGVIYLHGLHPRNGVQKHHQWIGVALGALIVAGLTGIPALSGLHQGIVNAVTGITHI